LTLDAARRLNVPFAFHFTAVLIPLGIDATADGVASPTLLFWRNAIFLTPPPFIFDALFISGVISSHSLFLAALARRACVTQLKTML
jgi:hypothetical protein